MKPMPRILVWAAVPVLALTLVGCGQKGDLQRPKSARNAPLPYGRTTQLSTASCSCNAFSTSAG